MFEYCRPSAPKFADPCDQVGSTSQLVHEIDHHVPPSKYTTSLKVRTYVRKGSYNNLWHLFELYRNFGKENNEFPSKDTDTGWNEATIDFVSANYRLQITLISLLFRLLRT